MQLRYSLTGADLRCFLKAWQRGRTLATGTWHHSLASLIALALLVFLLVKFQQQFTAFGWLYHLLLFLTGLAGLILLLQAYRYWRLAKMPPVQVTLSLGEEGLRLGDGKRDVLTRWRSLRRMVRTADHLFLIASMGRGVTIPLSAFADADSLQETLAALGRARPDLKVEGSEPAPAAPKKRRRWLLAGLAIPLALLAFCFFTPWRSSLLLPEELGKLSYMVTETGGAQADDTLPLIVDLHGLGGLPEIGLLRQRGRAFPARIALPHGDSWYLVGYSWYPLEEDMSKGLRRAADRIAAFTRAMMERYPTAGRPIVTGFSQGGSLSFALAAYHPDLFAAAVPVAGDFYDPLPARARPPALVVRALHGADDDMVPPDGARGPIERMRAEGWDARLTLYPETGHKPGLALRADWRRLLAELAGQQARSP